MALAIFSRNKPMIGTVVLDASITEEHAIDVDTTENPIEDGATVTDHAIVDPRELTMEVIVSAHPDQLIPTFSAVRHIQEYRKLQRIAKSRDVIDVVTTLERYRSMLIVHVGTPRTVENTNALRITCKLRQIEIARVDAAANLADLAVDGALGEEDLASQGTQAVPA